MMTGDRSSVCVFSPSLYLTVTVESGHDDNGTPEIHFHPGGQGFWVARMLDHLGEPPVLVAPVGGESGDVLSGLARTWGIRLDGVRTGKDSPAYIHDRREGERREIARTPPPALDRHEIDDFYGRVLEQATSAGMCVITGRAEGDSLPLDFYERLGADLAAVGARTVGDLHGEELQAFLAGGGLHILKVSDEDLMADGILPEGAEEGQRLAAIADLRARGVERMVISSSSGPAVAHFGADAFRAESPQLQAADHRGSGDAMTAALTVAAVRGYDAGRTLRMACAAGAANVTRHGLGNVHRELIESLSESVALDRLGQEEAQT
ncbi:MAG: PfkB family carbohydrate kinase [Rhodospirillaceae bacterium]